MSEQKNGQSAVLEEPEILRKQVEMVAHNPLVDAMMEVVGVFFLVLNEKRQVLAVNELFLNRLGIPDAAELMGLRPGVVLHCQHAEEKSSRCGATPYCKTCGAAIAMVECLKQREMVERTCAISVGDQYSERDLFFSIRAIPKHYDGIPLILLTLQDVTIRQQWAALEASFYHDIANILNGLLFSSELLKEDSTDSEGLADQVYQLSRRLGQELKIHRSLIKQGTAQYQPVIKSINPEQIFNELRLVYCTHPKAQERRLECAENIVQSRFHSDFVLVMRVIHNMVLNAFEASEPGGVVRVDCQSKEGGVLFSIWNQMVIPPEVQLRVFQRNYSTKASEGRGLGTFSMKFLGEKVLGGKVSFTSKEAQGTTFYFWLPVAVEGMAE